MSEIIDQLKQMQRFFATGATKRYEFRKAQLLRLKEAILKHEEALHAALHADLKKSAEESWVTETGFVISELNYTIRRLKKWMRPEKVGTNLLNFPSRSFIYKEPLGTVLVIGPWNYPFQLLFAPLAGALAAGNCVVLKPSEFARETAAVMERLVHDTFSTDHVLLLQGDGATVVPQLMKGFRFDHVFYTGSTAVGKIIYGMAAEKLVPVTLELGGKSPCVVESDADLKVAARRIAVTKFSNAGQMCVAPDYILAHRSIREPLVQELKVAIRDFFSDDPSSSYNYGKIINDRQFSRLRSYIAEGTVLHGGRYDAATHYMEPTLLQHISPDHAVMGEEIFGPVLPILDFEDFATAKQIIDRNPDPLAFYVFTQSREKEKQWLESIAFGGGCVNNASWHLTNHNLPFGGRGNSGIGSYHGRFSFDVFSHRKSVMKTPAWFDPALKYPPFRGKLKLFKKLIR